MRKSSLCAALALALGSLAAAPATAASADTAAADAASAAVGTCTVQMPRYLTVKAPYTRYQINLASDCAASGTQDAYWDLTHSITGTGSWLDFEGTSSTVLEWYEDYEYFGTYYLDPVGAYDQDFDDVAQNSGTVIVKAGSRASFNTARVKGGVTVNAGVTYYNGAADKMIPWKGATVSVQTSSNINGPFTTVATMKTASNGIATQTFSAPTKRYWRVTTPSTTSVFGSTSAPVWR